MSEWSQSALGDVVTLQRGHDLPETRRTPGTVPVIGSFGITGYTGEAKYPGPGVAVGRSGASIGVATYCLESYWPLNTCLFASDFHGNDPRWIYYVLKAIDFGGFNSGSAQPSLNRNYIADIPVALPPIEEQRAIAATLGALDDKIDSNRRVVSVALSLLDTLSAQAGERLPTVPLGELVEVAHRTVDPTRMGETVVAHFSLPAFDDGPAPEIVRAATILSNKQVIDQRSILVSRLNPRFNRTWWVTPHADTPAVASTEFLCVTAPNDLALAGVWLAVRDEYFREQLPKRVTGTSGSHQRIRPADALSIDVPDTRLLPSTTLGQALGLLDLVEARRDESMKLAAFRDALLPELLSGRLSPIKESR